MLTLTAVTAGRETVAVIVEIDRPAASQAAVPALPWLLSDAVHCVLSFRGGVRPAFAAHASPGGALLGLLFIASVDPSQMWGVRSPRRGRPSRNFGWRVP